MVREGQRFLAPPGSHLQTAVSKLPGPQGMQLNSQPRPTNHLRPSPPLSRGPANPCTIEIRVIDPMGNLAEVTAYPILLPLTSRPIPARSPMMMPPPPPIPQRPAAALPASLPQFKPVEAQPSAAFIPRSPAASPRPVPPIATPLPGQPHGAMLPAAERRPLLDGYRAPVSQPPKQHQHYRQHSVSPIHVRHPRRVLTQKAAEAFGNFLTVPGQRHTHVMIPV
ncbi:hypothetical protein HDU96_002145 [Phlyctochytrium bullatum]|nr:hypothetical protein HDU96_002145 [Phlyctochytrium bullatum]